MKWFTRVQQQRSSLFAMGQLGGRGHAIESEQATFAVIDFETTGLSAGTDRIVEVAIVRIDGRGRVLDEFATLIDPGCDVGPTFIHHITNDAVQGAPRFPEIAGAVLERLDGAVLVAHNASFEEAFLAAELARAGVRTPPLPALCTLELARSLALPVPNHRLSTCCEHFQIDVLDAHTALGDTRATAGLVSAALVSARARGHHHLTFPAPWSPLPTMAVTATCRHRVSNLRKGQAGWMAGVIAKLPVVVGEAEPLVADTYLELLAQTVADGKIVRDEARSLARLAGAAGLGSAQVASLHRRFLDGLREVAAADDHISRQEHRDLVHVAGLLGEPDYFVDLVCDDAGPATTRGRSTAKGQAWTGPLAGTRILFVGTGNGLDALRAAARANGATCARNVTKTLRCVVTDGEPDVRAARAQELGVPVLDVEAAAVLLGLAPSGTGSDPTADHLADATPVVEPALPPAGWYADPSGRWPHRWWDGLRWTDNVAVDGAVHVDAPVGA